MEMSGSSDERDVAAQVEALVEEEMRKHQHVLDQRIMEITKGSKFHTPTTLQKSKVCAAQVAMPMVTMGRCPQYKHDYRRNPEMNREKPCDYSSLLLRKRQAKPTKTGQFKSSQ